jgi:hypothetical protein
LWQDVINARSKENRTQTQQLVKRKINAYFFSKASSSAAYARLSMLIMIQLLATGRMSDDFAAAGIEAFYDGKRLLGSCTDDGLPAGLEDATQAEPLATPFDVIKSLRDGCGGQCAFILT